MKIKGTISMKKHTLLQGQTGITTSLSLSCVCAPVGGWVGSREEKEMIHRSTGYKKVDNTNVLKTKRALTWYGQCWTDGKNK